MNDAIFLLKDGVQCGPYTRDEIKARYARGEVRDDDWICWEGLPEWVGVQQSGLIQTAQAPPPPKPAPPPQATAAPQQDTSTRNTASEEPLTFHTGCLLVALGLVGAGILFLFAGSIGGMEFWAKVAVGVVITTFFYSLAVRKFPRLRRELPWWLLPVPIVLLVLVFSLFYVAFFQK